MANLVPGAKQFNLDYEPNWEDEAHAQRGEFLKKFPARDLKRLTLKRYAIGQNENETFCYWLEPGTRKWANITGATAAKFGIYFGKTRSDPTKRYRYTHKFSEELTGDGSPLTAFKQIRRAMVELVSDGRSGNFKAIDSNPLSQMLKAKILSLYFPDTYLPICSADSLRDLANKLKLDCLSLSEIQHKTLAARSGRVAYKNWSTLKWAAFLYEHVLGRGSYYGNGRQKSKKKKKSAKERYVDFEKLMEERRALGAKSEAYALDFEQARLRSLGYRDLSNQVRDRTKQPAYGYDFESFSTPRQRRFIEVKTFTAVNEDTARFFLSDNELLTARSLKYRDKYYFYLVVYKDGAPVECLVKTAFEVLEGCELLPQSYIVRLPRPKK